MSNKKKNTGSYTDKNIIFYYQNISKPKLTLEEFLAWEIFEFIIILILVVPKKFKKMRFIDIKVTAFNKYGSKLFEILFVFVSSNIMQQSESLLGSFNLILTHFEPKISDKMVFFEKEGNRK